MHLHPIVLMGSHAMMNTFLANPSRGTNLLSELENSSSTLCLDLLAPSSGLDVAILMKDSVTIEDLTWGPLARQHLCLIRLIRSMRKIVNKHLFGWNNKTSIRIVGTL